MNNKHKTNLINASFTIIFFFLMISIDSLSFASTARMKSTAGVGVGSILLDEATFLNPASSAFYKIGAFYYQKTNTESSIENSPNSIRSSTFIATDAKGKVAGSLSYVKHDNAEDHKKISLSIASIIGERSASGLTYHYEDEDQKKKFFTFGITHAINEALTMGFIVNDPTRVKPNNSSAIVGLQYTYQSFVTLMGDFGTDWKNRFDEKLVYGAGIQFKIYDDLYIRGGQKIDRQKHLKIKGVGASWSSPKFVANIALSFNENTLTNTEDKETTFSLSYKF